MSFNDTLTNLAARGDCPPLQGNPDLYGLGIRVGIYLQMLAVQVSGILSYILGSEDQSAEAAVIFVVSVAVVLLRLIINRDIMAIEVVPIMTLLVAQVNAYRGVNKLKTIAYVVYSAELIGLIGLAVWFWWHGMDTLTRTCHDKAFFFAKVSIWHWFRTFNKVLTVFTALGGLLFTGASVLGITWIAGTNLLKFFHILRGERRVWEHSEAQNQRPGNYDFSPTDFLVNVGVILFVELTIRWNHFTDVHSLNAPGQFMPFFIGLAQLLAVFYKGISNGLKRMANDDGSDSESEYESDLDCDHGHGLRRRGHVAETHGTTAYGDVELNALQQYPQAN